MRAALVAAAAALLRRGAEPGPPARHPGPAALAARSGAEAAESGEEDLWEGLDAERPDDDAPAPRDTVALLRVKGRQYAIAGQYDTGTNLLQKLIGAHLKTAVRVTQEAHKKADAGHYLWKHTKPENISQEVRKKLNGTVALVMVRDPLSWLQSLKKAPYDLKRCTKKEDWLTAPCATPATFTDWIAHPDPLASIPPPKFLYVPFPGRPALPNLESFWNEWTRDYTHMADFGFADSLVIRYEDLVTDTEKEIQRIAAILHLPPPTEVTPLAAAAKGHGKPVGRAGALKKLREKPYLALYSAADRAAVCARLDAALLRRFNYTDCL